MVREADRGVPGSVVGSRRTGPERARSAGAAGSLAPAWADAAGVHVQSALPAAGRARCTRGYETRTLLRRLALNVLFPDLEHHAKARFAAHHSLVRRLGLLERIDLVRRDDTVALAETQRVLRVHGRPRVPALDGGALAEQFERVDGEGANRANNHHRSIHTQSADYPLHGLGARDRGDDRRGATQRLQCPRGVAALGVDIVLRTQRARQRLFLPTAIDRHGTETLAGGKLNVVIPAHSKGADSTESISSGTRARAEARASMCVA